MGLGLFGGGVGAARYMVGQGARVTVTDLKSAEALAPSVRALEGLPITFHLGRHEPVDFSRAEVLVVNPAVDKTTSGFVRLAVEAGAEITSEMNLFFAVCPAPLVGVTGSNGKSTTAALLADMLARARPTRLGGNIGKSLLDALGDIRPDEIVVLELSSFQLEDLGRLGLSPHVAVVTNISPNHIDRHGTMEAYIEAKKNIVRFQRPGDYAILNGDDAELGRWRSAGQVLRFSRTRALEQGVFVEGTRLWFHLGCERDLAEPRRMPLRGRHNLWNVLAAATAARVLDVPAETIARAIEEFRPLPHRLQPVGMREGVLFVNDSKATTPLAAAAAIEAFDEPVVLIAGGRDKHMDPAPFLEAIRRRVKAAVLIGEMAPALEQGLGPGGPPLERAATVPEAVARAAARAAPGDVVLLAPGYTSWDMFDNYEQRGEAFRRAAVDLGMTPLEKA
jgi:UDP-N-acetylmuramoylalanine--D-glutamate ligase